MAEIRNDDLRNTRQPNNDSIVDNADSERSQQEYLITQTVQAKYEDAREKRIAKQNAYTTLYGQYKVLEGQYENSKAGKKLSLSFQFPNDNEGLESALKNDAELGKLKENLDAEKAKLDAAEKEMEIEKAVENAYLSELNALKAGLKAGLSIAEVLDRVKPTNAAEIREQVLNGPREQDIPQGGENTKTETASPNLDKTETISEGPIPESALPKAEKLHVTDFEKGYMPGAEKEKIKEQNPEADWAKIMERVLSEDTPEKAMDALFVSCLVFPFAAAAYMAELHEAEKKGRIKHVDEQAASWNKTMRKLKGLSEADVLQVIQGDFLHSPEGLIARYNKDVYEGLKPDQNGRYVGEEALKLQKRIAEKEEALKQTNPELFVGIQRDENGLYSPKDAEIFRTRFLMHTHPDLLSGIQKDKNGAYSEKDIALFKERLLTKNFMTVYERQPTVRELRGMVGGFNSRDKINAHIRAQEGIYGLALGMHELAQKESEINGAITHNMQQAWTNLRNGESPYEPTVGLERAYVDVPSYADKIKAYYAQQMGQENQDNQKDEIIDMRHRAEDLTLTSKPVNDFSISPQPEENSPYVMATPKAPDIFIHEPQGKNDISVSEKPVPINEAVVSEKKTEAYTFTPPTLTMPSKENLNVGENTKAEDSLEKPEVDNHANIPQPSIPVASRVAEEASIQNSASSLEKDNRPISGMAPPAPTMPPQTMAPPENNIKMTSMEQPKITVNREATTLEQAHQNLNAQGSVETMKVEKNALDKTIAGIRSKEQQLSIDGQSIARLQQNISIRTPDISLGKEKGQHDL